MWKDERKQSMDSKNIEIKDLNEQSIRNNINGVFDSSHSKNVVFH